MALAHMAQVGAAGKTNRCRVNPGLQQLLTPFRFEFSKDRRHRGQRGGGNRGHIGAGKFKGNRRGEKAQRRGDTGPCRADVARHLERTGNLVGMNRPGPTKSNQFEVTRIGPLLGHMDARGRNHIFVDDLEDPIGRGHEAEPQRFRNRALNRRLCCGPIQRHAPPQEIVRVEIAQDQVGVGNSRISATQAITGRTGRGTG